jgi:hypothetical protein
MNITYCKYWSFQKRPIKIYDFKQALKAHQKLEVYTVLIGDRNHPDCYLEINAEESFIGVNFLDKSLRNYLSYLFRETEPRRMFLKEVIVQEYEDETDKIIRTSYAFFKLDGTADIEKKDFITNEELTKTTLRDVSRNWEPTPEFGNYESICRYNRWEGLQNFPTF